MQAYAIVGVVILDLLDLISVISTTTVFEIFDKCIPATLTVWPNNCVYSNAYYSVAKFLISMVIPAALQIAVITRHRMLMQRRKAAYC